LELSPLIYCGKVFTGFFRGDQVEKRGYADSRRKGSADFLIRGMGSSPIDQRYFFRVDPREKMSYAD
jgi:hypothetical protein